MYKAVAAEYILYIMLFYIASVFLDLSFTVFRIALLDEAYYFYIYSILQKYFLSIPGDGWYLDELTRTYNM